MNTGARININIDPSGDRALKDADIDFIDDVGISVIDLARFVLEEEFYPVSDTFGPVIN